MGGGIFPPLVSGVDGDEELSFGETELSILAVVVVCFVEIVEVANCLPIVNRSALVVLMSFSGNYNAIQCFISEKSMLFLTLLYRTPIIVVLG